MQATSHRWNILLLGMIAALVLLWRLGGPSLAPWDEAIYAQVSKEIVQGKGWLTLHWADQPWFEKPPLMMWITAVLYRLFGVSEFWARAVSAFSGIGLVITTYLIGAFAYGKRVGLLGALILLTCYHFLSFARFGTMEVMLTLFTYLAVWGYLRLRDGNEMWWYLIWLCLALGLLTKGAAGLIAVAVVFLAMLFDGGLKTAIKSKHFWFGFLFALLIVVPWHAAMFARYDRAFIEEYVRYHVIARSTSTLEGHPSSYFYYLGRLVDGFFPWIVIVPFAIVASVRRTLKSDSPSQPLLLIALLVFGVYTIIPTRRPWYIVPLYPALAILIANFVVHLYNSHKSSRIYRGLIVSACVLLTVIGIGYCALSVSLNRRPEEPLVRLARMARSATPSDREPLLLLDESKPLPGQVPLFYSDRPIRQVYVSVKPNSEDAKRYLNYEKLVDLTRDATRLIILPQKEMEGLSADYEINVRAEVNPYIYAQIRRRN